MSRDTGDLSGQFDLLDRQSLDNLRSALDSANAKLQEMKDATQSAKDHLAELNATLLESEGQDQKAKILRQQLDYEQQLAAIEAQRATADAAHNRDLVSVLDEQRSVLDQINATKLASLEADAASTAAANKLSAATKGLSDQASALTQIHQAVAGIATTDLSSLTAQFGNLAASAGSLRSAL
jgi:chromosome segregation ATPase